MARRHSIISPPKSYQRDRSLNLFNEESRLQEEAGHTMLVNRRTLRIEWGQCDPAGIVFYPQYLLIFDSSTGWLFERTGLSPSAMRKRYGIVGMPIVEVGARFIIPCRFDDEVIVESEVSEWGRSSFTVRHRILKKGELALDGFEKRVWAAPHPERTGGIRAQPIPAEIIASLSDDTGMTTVSLAAAGKRESES